MACGTAGAALGATPAPVYFNFFDSPVRLDRYTRNMHALVASRVVAEPSLQGGHSLEMEFRFFEKDRSGTLLWDLVPVHVSGIRFNVFNPNPSRAEIVLNTTLQDAQKRSWLLATDGQPLAANAWTKVEANLAKDATVQQGATKLDVRNITDAVFERMVFKFEAGRKFTAFGKPLLLYLDGVECV